MAEETIPVTAEAGTLKGPEAVSLWSLFWVFLKIGSTAFGGFMALISVVQNYMVERRKLIRHEDMLDAISLATMLPGPIAVNVVAYTGFKLRGVMGAVVTATAVTLPSFVLLLILSYAYFTWGEIPSVNRFFQGFIPAVAAIIVAAVWNMGRKNITGRTEFVLALAAALLLLFREPLGIPGLLATVLIILVAGVVGYLVFRPKAPEAPDASKAGAAGTEEPSPKGSGKLYSSALIPAAGVVAPLLSTDILLAGKLLATFAGMSVLLFGGGFVFIPLMQESVVTQYGWLTQQEFVDGIALGQVTPGPIVMTATFAGFKVGGLLGATAATIGIFTPPAVIMLIASHYLERIKSSAHIKAALKGIRSAIIGLIAAAAYVVASTAEVHWLSLAIFALALLALMRFKLEVVWIIPTAGMAGFLLY
jgi:chromate transporter